MSKGGSTARPQVPCDVTEEELALDKLVNVIRLRYPSASWARLTVDGQPFVHVVDDHGDVELAMYASAAANVTDALDLARRFAESYRAMGIAALAILGG